MTTTLVATRSNRARSWLTIRIVAFDWRDLVLQPAAGRNVEVVVGFVEQQHLGTGVEQQIKDQSFALAAREFANESGREIGDRCLHAAAGGCLPLHFQVVTSEVTPVAERFGIANTVVGAGRSSPVRRRPSPTRRWRRSDGATCSSISRKVSVGLRHADVLGHRQHRAEHVEFALVGFDLAREDAQDGALASAVRPNDRRMFPRPDPEADVEEERVEARRGVFQSRDGDASHGVQYRRVSVAIGSIARPTLSSL